MLLIAPFVHEKTDFRAPRALAHGLVGSAQANVLTKVFMPCRGVIDWPPQLDLFSICLEQLCTARRVRIQSTLSSG